MAHERLKGQPSNKPMAQLGEHVRYLPLEASNTADHKVESKMIDGIWLGILDRTEEAIIGTEHGVVKCRTIRRRPVGQQWSGDAITKMKGTVQQLTPGVLSDHIPTGIV